MSNYTQHWIELRHREQRADGTWNCHYVIFEFGTREWRLKKGCVEGSFGTPEEAAAAALIQARQIIDSLQSAAACL